MVLCYSGFTCVLVFVEAFLEESVSLLLQVDKKLRSSTWSFKMNDSDNKKDNENNNNDNKNKNDVQRTLTNEKVVTSFVRIVKNESFHSSIDTASIKFRPR